MGQLERPRAVAADIAPDYRKFDRALKTQVRPVLVPLQRLPFRDFTAEEFLGRTFDDLPRPRWLRERVQGQHSYSGPNG